MDHINLVISSGNYVWKGDMIRASSAVKQSIVPTDPTTHNEPYIFKNLKLKLSWRKLLFCPKWNIYFGTRDSSI